MLAGKAACFRGRSRRSAQVERRQGNWIVKTRKQVFLAGSKPAAVDASSQNVVGDARGDFDQICLAICAPASYKNVVVKSLVNVIVTRIVSDA